jgi:2-phospho-L-lactate/phosphoenolpyruvate guanylyltransferase
MLEDVLDALLHVVAVESVLLVTPDTSLPDHLIRDRVRAVLDPGGERSRAGDGLNPAFALAQRHAEDAGVSSLLLLPADLPAISVADVMALVNASRAAGVVLAPDRAEGGTNAMLLSPPSLLQPGFGENSYDRHRRLASVAGVEPTVVRRPGIALVIVLASDVAAMLASNVDCRARRLLFEIGVETRLAEVLAAQAGDQARSATI